MRRPKHNLSRMFDADFLAPSLEGLRSEFKDWQEADSRGNQYLWAMLGSIYELAPRIGSSDAARLDLIEILREDPDVRASNKWRAENAHPTELLLVLLLGLNENTKSRKSQWRSALMAAKKAGVEAAKHEFVNWISEVGGVEGARKLVAKQRAPRKPCQIEDILKEVSHFDDAREIKLPLDLIGEDNIDGLSLMLVKHRSGDTIVPIINLADEKQILTVWEAYLRGQRKMERECRKSYRDQEAELKRIQSARKKEVRKLYQKAKAKGLFKGEFDEFLQEWETENLLTAEQKATRITEE